MKNELSTLDRLILAIAPEWGARRIRARAVAAQLGRHYEAASSGRRTTGWARTLGNADVINALALNELRMHARDLARNNAWARRAQRVIANNTVGWGIVPKANGPDANKNKAADAAWRAWASSTSCETEGRHTFAGLQHLAMKTLVTDGEVLFRRRWRKEKDGLAVPMQVQVLEADYLAIGQNANGSLAGGPIINGVEFDKIGRRAAYWLYPEHPGSGRNTNPPKRIPASEIIHLVYTERPGQTRGTSWLAAAIVNLKDLDEYEDAELVKQKIAACFAAFVTDDGNSQVLVGEQSTTDALVETLEPGMISRLPPGKQVQFGNPPQLTSDGLPTRTLRKIAAGIGVTYEDMTGDYSQVNFSSARMSRIAHWGNVRDWQFNMLIPLLCDGVWRWVMEAAAGSFAADLLETTADWTTPPMPMIEPDKEGLAYQRLVRNGVMTFSQMVREQGGDPEAHWQEYAADQKVLDALGIQLDTDVRAVSAAGLTQVRVGAGKAVDETARAIMQTVLEQQARTEKPVLETRSVDDFDIDEDPELSPEVEAAVRAAAGVP